MLFYIYKIIDVTLLFSIVYSPRLDRQLTYVDLEISTKYNLIYPVTFHGDVHEIVISLKAIMSVLDPDHKDSSTQNAAKMIFAHNFILYFFYLVST